MTTDKPRFCLIDNALTSLVGHFLEYDKVVMDNLDASKFDRLMFSNADFLDASRFGYIPSFYTNFWNISKTKRPLSPSRKDLPSCGAFVGMDRLLSQNDLRQIDMYRQDLINVMDIFSLSTEDLLFFPNINPKELFAILQIIEGLRGRLPYLKFVLRRNIFVGPPDRLQVMVNPSREVLLLRLIFERLEKYKSSGKISFYTDSERLKDEYEVVAPFEFKVLPVPFRHSMIREKSRISGPLRIVYLGDARSEKGFQHIPALVRAMKDHIDAGRIEFILQTSSHSELVIKNAIAELRKFERGVTLLSEPLTDEEYYNLLNSADISLIFYDPKQYYSRTSCIFVESVISCTPFITSSGSWMESVMDTGTGEVVDDFMDLPKTLTRMIDHYEEYVITLNAGKNRWMESNAGSRFVSILMDGVKTDMSSAMPVVTPGSLKKKYLRLWFDIWARINYSTLGLFFALLLHGKEVWKVARGEDLPPGLVGYIRLAPRPLLFIGQHAVAFARKVLAFKQYISVRLADTFKH
ncbi:MAG TPA: hypothetical protein VN328_07690 [Thermodesulfovibrionales bacterium]|nr:hypothetical protein [Thermodesulfovibrionales bacterium]